MKVSELISLLKGMNQDADVMFDTEAQTYDVHLVPVDAVYAEGPEAGLDREIVYFTEDHPHRSDDRDARIVELESTIAALEAGVDAQDKVLTAKYNEQLARANAAEALLKNAKKEAKRWRAMFEHAALLVADEIEMYGLAGDEATEEIERWVELAAAEKGE